MRLTPAIGKMSPEQIIRKKPFSVPIPPGVVGTAPILNPGSVYVAPLDNVTRELKTQADFVREFYPSSHKINNIKYYPNTMYVNKESGAYQAKVRSRIAVGFQQYIHLQRKEALLGNNVGMRLVAESTNQQMIDRLAFFREGWEDKDMEVAVNNAVDAAFAVGDVAVYVYMDDYKVHWRVFSYNDGDILYPHYDTLTGELALFGRLYNQADWDGNTKQYLDVVDKTSFVTYRKDDDNNWVMEGEPQPHGFPICPVAYHRNDNGPVWSASQSLIDGWEIALSQFSENNAAYALRILYTLGGDFELMTNTDGTPNRIDSIDPNAKVGFLEPAAGADGAFTKQLDLMKKEILRGSFVVETPEIKSGADISSRTVKMMFADSYMKAMSDSMEYQGFLNRVAVLFKHGYFTEKNRITEAESLRVKTYLDPFIFLSENDVIAGIQQLVTCGAMSTKTATELAYNIGYSSPDEVRRILQETHDELVAEAEAKNIQTAQPSLLEQKANPVAESRNAGQ